MKSNSFKMEFPTIHGRRGGVDGAAGGVKEFFPLGGVKKFRSRGGTGGTMSFFTTQKITRISAKFNTFSALFNTLQCINDQKTQSKLCFD